MIISIGMTIQTIYSDFEIFIDNHFMSPPALMVAIGILLLFVSSFGCIGAIRESTMLINVVSGLDILAQNEDLCLSQWILTIRILPVWRPFSLHLHLGAVGCHRRIRAPQPGRRDVDQDHDECPGTVHF